MCLVIDANMFCLVFGKDKRFQPIREWINGRGRMIYGGTKYNKELEKGGMLRLIKELETGRKTVHIPNETVDTIAAALKAKFPESAFNDEHIVALVIASRCRVVCTDDKTAMAYLRCPDVFADYAVGRPTIFRGHKTHLKMCCEKNIVPACR